ncbi:MAG: ATP-binding cassette domain-containing protein [Eubacterium sp.]|nr:ATP-binding cassette domain-containing protein [Eubacterium sp.]
MAAKVVETYGLTKTYGRKSVVDNVNMTIYEGDIYGLIGKNGAGKTTIMKMISGLAHQTKGEIKLFGNDGTKNVLNRVGCLIEQPSLFPDMNASDHLRFYNKLLGITDNSNVKEILEMIGLAGNRKVTKKYSMGMKQRLAIGIALLGYPDFLLLDEPVNGLDPEGIVEVRNLLIKLNKEKNMTILISSHILGELSKLSTRYGIIDDGNLLEEFTEEELEEKCKKNITLKTYDVKSAAYVLENNLSCTDYKVVDESTIYIYDHLDEVSMINKALVEADIAVEGIGVKGQDLEEYFIERMGGKSNE